MGFWSSIKSFFTGHTSITHPATGQPVSTATLKQIPTMSGSAPSPVQMPKSVPGEFPIVTLDKVSGCTDAEIKMLGQAVIDVCKVFASTQFKDAFLSASFTETRGYSCEDIYDLMVSSSPIKINFTMFDGTRQQNLVWLTQGYEDENYPGTVFANRYFMEGANYCASLIIHEVMHVLGFTHYGVMETSVPYVMNGIYYQVATALSMETPEDNSADDSNGVAETNV